MILDVLPKIKKITTGAAAIESEYFSLSNFRTAVFLLETGTENDKLKISVVGAVGEKEQNVGFLYKNNADAVFTEVEAEGIEVTHTGTEPQLWLVLVTADSLSHDELERIKLKLDAPSRDTVETAYVFLSQPRYTENEQG